MHTPFIRNQEACKKMFVHTLVLLVMTIRDKLIFFRVHYILQFSVKIAGRILHILPNGVIFALGVGSIEQNTDGSYMF